jgi:drug/metabolite transporter (DMT)-like permease
MRHENDIATEAGAALLAVRKQRAAAADRLVSPWWYHPCLGVLVGALLAAQATHSPAVQSIAAVAILFGVGVLAGSYRRRTGLWVSGYRRGPAGRVTLALVAAYLACALAAGFLDFELGQRWAFVAAGAVAAIVTVVLGRRFDEALRDELRAGS